MLRLIQQLNSERFEHIVCCPSEEGGILEELSRCPNCQTVPMNFRSISDLPNILKLLKLVKKGDFDLIHSHGKAAGLYSRIVGKFTGLPVVHHLHGIHYKEYFRPLQFLYQKIEALLSSWSRLIICVSDSERREGLSLEIFSQSQSVVVRNGVDTEQFKNNNSLKSKLKKEWGVPQNAKVIISITRMSYQKNPELSLEIHAQVCQKYPATYLFLIGISPDSEKLRDLAKKLGISDRVIMTDKQAKMHELLNIGDIYLSNSRWEGLSLGLIEAMSMEMPVVLSEVVGNEEMLNGKNDGTFFVQNMSTIDYLGAIEHLLKNESLSKDFGMIARKKIQDHFSLNDNIRKMEAEYMQIFDPTPGVSTRP